MPVGARVAERARARASVRVHSQDHVRPALGQPASQREGSGIRPQLVSVLHLGTCCVLAHRGGGVTL